jgi:predicted HTH transcriptional regulator
MGPGQGEITVFVLRGEILTISQSKADSASARREASDYNSSILAVIGERPASSQQIARKSGHRNNSYFRRHLAELVETGLIVHTRRGYSAAK